MARTAAALVIGNEILTGKTQEQNVAFLAKELFDLGVELRRVVVCPDDIDCIVTELHALCPAHDVVFTSGGVGPTHDDVTLDAVARAVDRPLVRSEELAALIRGYFGDRCTEEHLRMANVPEGSELLRSEQVPWPTVVAGNVFIFPGVPEIFRAKFPVVRGRLRADAPFVSRAVFTLCEEGEIAELLARLARQFPSVSIGSYLKWRGSDYSVKVTFDGRDRDAIERASSAFTTAIPKDKVLRAE